MIELSFYGCYSLSPSSIINLFESFGILLVKFVLLDFD
jgi:hypothetical protein